MCVFESSEKEIIGPLELNLALNGPQNITGQKAR
jgi:hypothetical protein